MKVFAVIVFLFSTLAFAAVNDSGFRSWNLLNTTDSVSSAQLGTWNLTNITGTITLPTGAATSANQTSEISQLTTIATNTAQNSVKLLDGFGNQITSQNNSSLYYLGIFNFNDGASGTGIAQPTGGAGILGWLSGIYSATSASATDFFAGPTNLTAACTTPAACSAGTVASITGQGVYTVNFTVSGTFVGTIQAEGQNGTSNTWSQLPMYFVGLATPYPQSFTLTAPATVLITGGGYQNIRLRMTSYTSGTAVVYSEASLAQQTIFASQIGSWNSTSLAVYNSTLPTIANAGTNAMQLDANGRLLTSSTPLDGSKATYSAATLDLSPANTPSDIFTIKGSATKTIRILKIRILATETTASTVDIVLLKRSTADTSGTSTNPTAVPHDSNNPAATAVLNAYTTNPTRGTLVGNLRSAKLFVPTLTTASGPQELIWQFGDLPGQALVLRGVNDQVAVNLNSITMSGGSFDIDIEWTEE